MSAAPSAEWSFRQSPEPGRQAPASLGAAAALERQTGSSGAHRSDRPTDVARRSERVDIVDVSPDAPALAGRLP